MSCGNFYQYFFGLDLSPEAEPLSLFIPDGATLALSTVNDRVEVKMNHLFHHKHLSNRYFAMRHGHSLANLEGIIVSHSENGVSGYGLSEAGEAQVRKAARKSDLLDSDTLIISSDFKRARESADIVHELLQCRIPACFDLRLRERHFGELELSSDGCYAEVWREDKANPDSRFKGTESARQVMARVTELVSEYEKSVDNKTLLIVSHGDALQILQTAFSKQCASKHRDQQHLETAKIRELVLTQQVD